MLRKWIWRDFANITLGCWLIASAVTFGQHSRAMVWSDLASGGIIAVCGVLTLFPRFDLARWIICAAGIWLLFAPLVFWTPDPAAYANDSLVGMLVIAFSVLIPMMPSRTHHHVMMMPGPVAPPGWSYNPSDWMQRGPIIALAFVGFFISRYLAAYQLGHISYPWDPFFRDGTQRVLDSEVSRAWPISDAGLGAVSYSLEALSGFMGGRTRWRTMPWMVAMFGFLVIPLGIVSIVLVILQPVAVGFWCALCLVTAVAMLVMISPAFDEVVAMGQFLVAARREGRSFWRTFWVGGTLESRETEPPAQTLPAQFLNAVELQNVPWNLMVSAALGVWLMSAPAVFGVSGGAATTNYIAGAMAVTWAVVAFGEVARPARFLNVPVGLWLIASAWLTANLPITMVGTNMLSGVLLIALSWRRGAVEQQYGGWNRFLV